MSEFYSPPPMLIWIVGSLILSLIVILVGWTLDNFLRLEEKKRSNPIWAIILSYLTLAFLFSNWFYLIRDEFKKTSVGETNLLAYINIEKAINKELEQNGKFMLRFDQLTNLVDISSSDSFVFRASRVEVGWVVLGGTITGDADAFAIGTATEKIISELNQFDFGTLVVVSDRVSPSDAQIIIEFDPLTLEIFKSYDNWFPWAKSINQEDRILRVPFRYNLKEFSDELFVGSIELTYSDCLYFGFLNALGASYGDIIPIAPLAKISAIMEVLGGFVLLSVVASHVLGKFSNVPLSQLFDTNTPTDSDPSV